MRIQLVYNDEAIKLFKDDDEAVAHEINLDVFESTTRWLCDSGYIWIDTQGESSAHGVVLSPKGLEVLKLVPESLKDNVTIGDKLLSIVKGGSIEARASLIGLALTEGSKLLVT